MTGRPPTAKSQLRSIAPHLLAVYAVIWIALAIAPRFREDWLLENVLVLVAGPWLVYKYRRQPFSNLAYGCLFVFFALHAIGAHYTYSEVPYDAWWQAATGHSFNELLGWQRNNFDRVVHAAYGLLIAPAAVELLDRVSAPAGFWRWLLPWTYLCAHSLVYELIEWAAALVFGGDLGVAYLGTQGDPWDSQRDMALACGGAAVAIGALRLAATGHARSA